jgi:hypothetical protein
MSLPLIAWGTAQDISASPWTDNGTPTVTPNVTDPFGGTGAYLIDDNDAGLAEARLLVVNAVAGSTVPITVCLKAGTSSTSLVQLRDQTAASYPLAVNVTWSGGVPSATATAGTVIGTVSLGNGWYLLLATAAWTSGHDARLELYGTGSTASLTGTTNYYVRNFALPYYPDMAVSEPAPRDGSLWALNGDGSVEDAWIVGTEERLRCLMRWIPQSPRATPVVQSGWYGQNESVGVNCGMKAMLTAGRDKQALLWVPDRSTCTTYQSSYLVEPIGAGAVSLEANGDRTFELVLRGTSAFTGY